MGCISYSSVGLALYHSLTLSPFPSLLVLVKLPPPTPCRHGGAFMYRVSSAPHSESGHMTQVGQSEYSIPWPKGWAPLKPGQLESFQWLMLRCWNREVLFPLKLLSREDRCKLPASWTKPAWECQRHSEARKKWLFGAHVLIWGNDLMSWQHDLGS